jgi:signal transduction histidine kinase
MDVKSRRGPGRLWALLAVLAAGEAAIIISMSLVLSAGNEMIAAHAPLVDAAMQIRLDATNAHLWLEEILAGYRTADMNDVWRELEDADWYARAMLEGGTNPEGRFIPLKDEQMREKVTLLRQTLQEFSELTEKRYRLGPAANDPTEEINKRYHAVFQQFAGLADDVDTYTALRMEHDIAIFRMLQMAAIATSVIISVLMGITLVSYIRHRRRIEAEREDLLGKLASKNDELEGLLYAGSHDLRSPLVNIQGFNTELAASCNEITAALSGPSVPKNLREELSHALAHDIPESLDRIRASANKMDTLVNGLLKLSRLGHLPLEIRKVDMNSTVAEIIKSMQHQINQSKAQVTVGNLPACKADAEQITRVFTNLIDNAIKYLSPERPGQIRISGSVQGERVVYKVEDNGLGIAETYRKKVFEIFQRVAANGPVAGEGLGLTIVRRLLDRQGGRIWLESELGKGSTFYISLPAALKSSSAFPTRAAQ